MLPSQRPHFLPQGMFHNFVNYHNLPIAGRLKHFLPAREQVTKDPWVLQVTQGYLIEFMTEPAQTCTPVSMFTTQENQNLIDQEVQELLAKQAVHPVSPSSQHEQGFISSLFVVPKKGGGGGSPTGINLKPLNMFLPYEHFKMELINMLKDLLRKDDYLVKIDLKDAYLTVPIWKGHQKYLRFLWRDSLLEFSCLPFGLASAPRVFTKLMKPVLSILRQSGVRLIAYLDDFLIMGETRQLALQHAATTLNLLEGLGFVANYPKSVLIPSQEIEFLGFIVNSLNLSLSLPTDKIKKVRQNCQRLLDNPVVTVRELAKFLGLLSASVQAVFPAPLNYRYLQHAKNSVLKKQKSYEALVTLDPRALQEVHWWRDNLVAWNGKALLHQPTDLTIETDASLKGWGAHCQGISTVGRWSQSESRYHINCLELLVGSLAVKCFIKSKAKAPSAFANGQCYSSNVHKQNGRPSLTSSFPTSQRPVGLVSEPQCIIKSSVSPRNSKCSDRSRIQSISRLQRLEAKHNDLRPSIPKVGPSKPRTYLHPA